MEWMIQGRNQDLSDREIMKKGLGSRKVKKDFDNDKSDWYRLKRNSRMQLFQLLQ